MQLQIDFEGIIFDEHLGELNYKTFLTLEIEKTEHAIFYEITECQAEFFDAKEALVDAFYGRSLYPVLENEEVYSKILRQIQLHI